MAKRAFKYKGVEIDKLKELSLNEFMKLTTSRVRRTLSRGFTDQQKILLKKIRSGKKNVKTHQRDMIILPEFVGEKISIHNGKAFVTITIMPEMVGHFLGEYVLTRVKAKHSVSTAGPKKKVVKRK